MGGSGDQTAQPPEESLEDGLYRPSDRPNEGGFPDSATADLGGMGGSGGTARHSSTNAIQRDLEVGDCEQDEWGGCDSKQQTLEMR